MADITYTVNQDDPNSISGFEQFSQADTNLIGTFQVNNLFDSTKNLTELHILSLSDTLLESHYDYSNYKLLGNAESAGKSGASIITIDPIEDSKLYGYQYGGIKLLYHFLNDLYTIKKERIPFFVEAISPDRTELRLQSLDLSNEDIKSFTQAIKDKLASQSYFSDFRLNFDNNDLFIGINIDVLDSNGNSYVVVKLYEPLPTTYDLKSTTYITEIISDSVAFEVDSLTAIDTPTPSTLRSPNFNLDVVDYSVIPTGYYSYNDLFSYPVNNTNSQVFSLYSEKGAELSIDHSDYSNFVHFSSAYERLVNFKYKLQLVESYSSSLGQITTQTSQSLGTTGSVSYYNNLIQGVLDNFDHYERFLYYKSSSYAWPKSNTVEPYINLSSRSTIATNWYANQLAVANSYDLSNGSILINTIPSFLRDDPDNDNYLTFIYMIGQHFDNLWVYGKAVTDKYNGDNRTNYGISKDLVGEALKNFGVKLYTSNKSTEDLFASFIGQGYQSGSEVINYYITGSVTGSNIPVAEVSYDDYNKEVQKRIYHNLSHLLKTKGTERGLRALINCFGIPSDILKIKQYGGRNINERPFYGDYRYYTSSLDKIRLDNTGSIVSGSTLSQYTSIVKREYKYTDDLHPVEIGFSPTDNVDNYIINRQTCVSYRLVNGPLQSFYSYTDCTGSFVGPVSILGNRAAVINALQESIVVNGNFDSITPLNSTSSFNIDNYLGDPRNLYLNNYYILSATGSISSSLGQLTDQIMSSSAAYDVQDYIRLIKFFDNTIFKMVKDFIPARSTADTGVIIKPHLLQRNKAKSVQVEVEDAVYTGSIDTAFITGSNGSTFGGRDNYITSYIETVQTPIGLAPNEYHFHGEATFDGEFEGTVITVSTGSLNAANPFKYDNPVAENLYITLIQDFPSNICVINPSYTPIQLTSHSPRNIALDFTSLGISGIVFTTGSTDITSQITAFSFPSENYTQHTISASNSSLVSCSGSITYTTAYCDITSTGLAPYSITSGSPTAYNLTTWFTTGSNTNTSFTASWGSTVAGISNPTTYTFTQPVTSVVITRRDNIIAGCSQSITIDVVAAPYVCLYLDYITILKNGGEGLPDQGRFSYIPCNQGAGGLPISYDWEAEITPTTIDIDLCIASGSFTNLAGGARPTYSASGVCS